MNADPRLSEFHLFDRDAEVLVVERALPHWGQSGAVCFITWRTHDSMPKQVLERWFQARQEWLAARGVDCSKDGWQQRLKARDPHLWHEFRDIHWNRWHDSLDAGHGSCILQERANAEIIADSLRHFDGERYLLLDYILMPNHVHLLASFPNDASMLAQCKSWKRYSALRINERLQRAGRIWQADAFDHLVRTEKQFEYLRRYIAGNPQRARLQPGEWLHYSRPLP